MDVMEMIKEFIKPELIILVPVLYLIGVAIKKSECNNKYIPLFLGCISIILCVTYLAANTVIETNQDILLLIFTSITQGILLAGASVYINQLKKQHTKSK